MIAAGLLITAAAWQKQSGTNTLNTCGTVPQRNKKIQSIEDALEQLEKSKIELDRTMKKNIGKRNKRGFD